MPSKSIVALASIVAAFGLATPAYAAGTFTVNTTLDTNTPDMVLSLREAILVSNGTISGTFTAQEQAQMSGCTFDGGGNIAGGCGDGLRDTIIVPAGTYTVTIPGTTTEGTGDFDITEDVTIQGAGAATTIVDGNDLDRVFEITFGAPGVSMSGLTIRNGQTAGVGGGIFLPGGGLTLASSVVEQNTSPYGGGIYNGGGDLTLVGSRIANNDLGSTTAVGGGIYNEGGGSVLDVESGSVISGNDARVGAGIYNTGTVTIRDTQVVGNDAALDGGGISTQGTMSITSSRLTGNTAVQFGGGILSVNGTLTLTNSVVQGNNAGDVGGGISNREATLTITGSSVIGNTGAPGGGGISVANASATIVNTTISGNSTNFVGGGLLVEEFLGTSTVTLNNVTIANNTADADAPTGGGDGGGLSNASGDVTLRNTVLAGNADRSSTGAVHPDCNGSFISAGHNLIQNATGCTFAAGAGDLVGQLPRLGSLTDLNGAFVHPLLSDSPAIDAGDPATCAATDQRGVPRPQHAACDMGAYEYELPFSLTIGNARVKEGDRGRKAMVFLVRLSAPRAQPVSVGFRTQKGTAKPRQDFVGRRGRLTFAPGETLRRLVIRIRGDFRDERREKFRVVLRNPAVATIADGIGVGTIRDNDPRLSGAARPAGRG